MDPYKFIGPAGIHPRILKNLAVVITKPLSIIFERSWEPEEVPADWKLVNIVLILRKGKKEDLRNYRFVSLTSVPSLFWEVLKTLGGQCSHWSQPAWLHDGEVLCVKPAFFL